MIDITSPPQLWLPPKPAIIRAAEIGTAGLKISAFMPGFRCPAPSSAVTIAFRSSTISSGTTIAIPSGCVAGDLLVLLSFGYSLTTAPSAVDPAGFTRVANDNSNRTSQYSPRIMMHYKLATGTETTLTGMGGSGATYKVLSCFSGGISSVTPSTFAAEAQWSNAVSNQTISASGQSPPLIAVAGYGSVNTITTTFSPSGDGNVDVTGPYARMTYKIYNTAPADHTVGLSVTSAKGMASGFLICT